MSLHNWWLFLGVVFLLCGTPGPNMLHVLSRAIRFGVRRSVAAMAGCMSAIALVLALSAAGLSALLIAMPQLFDVMRYAGMAYLVYLGIKSWRGSDAPFDVGAGELPSQLSAAAMFKGGLLIGISNPKLILFAAAFLPQFIDPALPQGPQFAILVATFALVEMFWYGVYAIGGRRLASTLETPRMRRWFNRFTGAVFVGFGVALLKVRN